VPDSGGLFGERGGGVDDDDDENDDEDEDDDKENDETTGLRRNVLATPDGNDVGGIRLAATLVCSTAARRKGANIPPAADLCIACTGCKHALTQRSLCSLCK
jgi:hypothetical protein